MVRRAALQFGEKLAIAFRDTNLAFRQLEDECCRFAHLMQQYRIDKGDRVVIIAFNSHYYLNKLCGAFKNRRYSGSF